MARSFLLRLRIIFNIKKLLVKSKFVVNLWFESTLPVGQSKATRKRYAAEPEGYRLHI